MNVLTDKELITEVLTTEKNLANLYNTAVEESSTEPLHTDLNGQLMKQKGLYQLEQVQQPAIDKVKNKFAQAAGQ